MNYKLLIIFTIFLTLIFFYATRFNNINQTYPDADTFSWLYRINYYPWIVSSNLKGIDVGENRDLKYAGTISYHPGVTIMTFSGISTKIGKAMKLKEDQYYESCAYMDFSCKYLDYEQMVAKTPLIIISGILLGLSLYLLSYVFSLKSLIPWILFILLEPLLLVSSKALHLDYLFAMFSIAAVSCLIYSLDKNKKWIMILAGSLMGFALLTRFAGSFMVPGILASLVYLDHKNFIRNAGLFALGGIAAFVGFYPAMWVAPIETLTYIIKASSEISDNLAGTAPAYVRYFNSLKWYFESYSKALSFASILFLFAGIGGLFVPGIKKRRFVYSILIIYLTYFAFVNLADKQYVRYLVPVVIGIMIPASIGLENLIQSARKILELRKFEKHSAINSSVERL